jgi:hypothetical protein
MNKYTNYLSNKKIRDNGLPCSGFIILLSWKFKHRKNLTNFENEEVCLHVSDHDIRSFS